jgi:hypothetical protein
MSLSWISNRSLKVSPRAKLVDDAEAEALRRKLEAVTWRPTTGFLKDQEPKMRGSDSSGGTRAA